LIDYFKWDAEQLKALAEDKQIAYIHGLFNLWKTFATLNREQFQQLCKLTKEILEYAPQLFLEFFRQDREVTSWIRNEKARMNRVSILISQVALLSQDELYDGLLYLGVLYATETEYSDSLNVQFNLREKLLRSLQKQFSP
jgi:hypothetical protein